MFRTGIIPDRDEKVEMDEIPGCEGVHQSRLWVSPEGAPEQPANDGEDEAEGGMGPGGQM